MDENRRDEYFFRVALGSSRGFGLWGTANCMPTSLN